MQLFGGVMKPSDWVKRKIGKSLIKNYICLFTWFRYQIHRDCLYILHDTYLSQRVPLTQTEYLNDFM